jgi:hypothetical protein
MATTLEQHLERLYHSRYHSTTYLVPSFLTEMFNHRLKVLHANEFLNNSTLQSATFSGTAWYNLSSVQTGLVVILYFALYEHVPFV